MTATGGGKLGKSRFLNIFALLKQRSLKLFFIERSCSPHFSKVVVLRIFGKSEFINGRIHVKPYMNKTIGR